MPDPIAPLRALVGALLAAGHDLLVPVGLPPGVTWLLAVALLVVLVRAALLPLAVGQFRSAARMRALAPDLRRIQDRYRGRSDRASREALAAETMALYRERGVRPLASFLPVLIQVPVLLALLQALEQAASGSGGSALASFAVAVAAVLGAPLAATALSAGWPGALVGGSLLVLTAGAQLLTQHLATATPSPIATALLLLPLITAVTGLLFPIGVVAYWCVSALWTLGQQLVLYRLVSP